MATYRIDDDFGLPIFDTSDPDTLIITRTGYLLDGVDLGKQGGWTVTIDGGVGGPFNLMAGNSSESTITIGRTGLIQSNDILFDGAGLNLQSAVTVKNDGLITARTGIALLGVDHHVITNTGTIVGTDYSIHDATGLSGDEVTNLGTLKGKIDLSGGADHLVNTGRIFGDVFLGDGDDTFTNSDVVAGNIDLGAGNDRFDGGDRAERVYSGAGSDTVDLGGGDDFFYAFTTSADGGDTIQGGRGTDTFSSYATSGVINLDNVDHDGWAANTAWDNQTGLTDTILGFENADGGVGAYIIYGSGADNFIEGGSGTNQIFGFGGNDTLYGGYKGDSITGGLGQDTLAGGYGADTFIFNTLAESGVKATTRDVILDFKYLNEADVIDLRGIDAIAGGSDDAFHFIGMNVDFQKAAGDLRARWITNGSQTDTQVEGDVNGDGKADFAILLKGQFTLSAGDFVL